MAKSNRQRRRDRVVRHAKSARKQAAARSRQAFEAELEHARLNREKIRDPRTPVAEVAIRLFQTYDGEPVSPRLVAEMQDQGATPDRLVQIAQALRAELDASPDKRLTYLTFAAGVAHVAGDDDQARRLLDEALSFAGGLDDEDGPAAWHQVVRHLPAVGRLGEALELIEARLRRDPRDEGLTEQYAVNIAAAFTLVTADGPAVHPREQAALDRFADRSGLVALQDAVADYLPRSEYRVAIDAAVAGWLSIARDWERHERAALAVLVAEQAQIVETPDGTVPDEDDSLGLLRDFAVQPGVPPELAERARAWQEHIHYGLWQVAEPSPAPGVECVDITTGVIRYVEFPAEMIERLPRWGVLFGPVVPVDGIWRSTGNAVQLSPSEADAMAETLIDALEGLVQDLSGQSSRRAFRRARQPVPFGQAAPHNVLAYHGDPAAPQTVQMMTYVTGSLLPRLTVDLHEYRTAPPALRNSDGDPMMVINTRIAVRDAAALAAQLADHADFRRDEDDPAQLIWLGKIMPEDQRAVMLADLKAGHDADDAGPAEWPDDGPQRWVRGQIKIQGRDLTVEVNSEQRLARLLEILTKLGASPSVIDQTRVDPTQDFAWPTGPVAIPRGAAPAADGWEKHWLDGPVPVLHGRTPRQVADSDDWPVLEAMLRQWEYEADILAASGQAGVDTDYLRAELNLPADPWEIRR